MNLTQRSYIRTHKQSVVHLGELTREIVDFRSEYEDMYLDVISKISESLTNNILQRTFYEKWDGVMPKVLGSNSSIMDVTSLLSDE